MFVTAYDSGCCHLSLHVCLPELKDRLTAFLIVLPSRQQWLT